MNRRIASQAGVVFVRKRAHVAARAAVAVEQPYTTCETMNAGWAWQIEHEERVNQGYVYASAFVDDDEAEHGVPREEPEGQADARGEFVSGRYARRWVKNVTWRSATPRASSNRSRRQRLGVIGVQSSCETGLITPRPPRGPSRPRPPGQNRLDP